MNIEVKTCYPKGWYIMTKLSHCIHIDMRNPQASPTCPLDISCTDHSANRPVDEQLLVVMHDPTPHQALRHAGASLALFGRALLRAFDAYARRIDRGYIRTHYAFRNGIID